MTAAGEAEVLSHEGEGMAIELGIEEQRRLERVEGLVGQRCETGAPRFAGEPLEIEGEVLAGDEASPTKARNSG